MAWDARKTYYYLVCFATLIMMIVGGVQLVRSALDLTFPEEHFRMSPMDVYERYQRPPAGAGNDAPFTREELIEMADQEASRMERQARRRALRSLIGNIALLLIAAPVYLYHWRQVRHDEVGPPRGDDHGGSKSQESEPGRTA